MAVGKGYGLMVPLEAATASGLALPVNFSMKALFVVACCVLLGGCAGENLSGSAGSIQVEDGRTYTPGLASGSDVPPVQERITTTCTMSGQSAVCH